MRSTLIKSFYFLLFASLLIGCFDKDKDKDTDHGNSPPIPVPIIASISPVAGALNGGTSMTITGTGFIGDTAVAVGGSACGSVEVVSSTSITCITSSHEAGNVAVAVTNSTDKYSILPNGFTYQAAPSITDISPSKGAITGRTAVTITGTGFLPGAIILMSGNACGSATGASLTSITCITPPHEAGIVDVVLINSDNQSGTLSGGYTYQQPALTLSSIFPVSGSVNGGTAVTITGTGFLPDANVTIGGNSCNEVTVESSTSITCTTAAHGAGIVDIEVTNRDSQSGILSNAFTFMSSFSGILHEAYLKAPNASNGDEFGLEVGFSGNTAIVASRFEDSSTTSIIHGSDLSTTDNSCSASGAVYVFSRSGSIWAHEAYLKAPNSDRGDHFGTQVHIDGDTIVVGAEKEGSTTKAIINGSDLSATNNLGDKNGAAYVFKRTNSTWVHEAYLKAPNNSSDDWFGRTVTVEGDTIVVGAMREDSSTNYIINGADLSATNDSGYLVGAAYVFKRTGSSWAHEAYLKAPNPTNVDEFGSEVGIDTDTIVVGTYYEDSDTGSIINGTDLSSTNNAGNNNGAAYVFKRSGSTWTHEAFLKAPNTSSSDLFGRSVSIDGDTIVVGAINEDSDSTKIINGSDLSSTNDFGNNNGAAYVFRRYGSTWVHEAYLKAPNTSDNDQFGIDVAISGDMIVVGAFGEDSDTTSSISGSDLSSTNSSGSGNGAAYVFRRTGTNWALVGYLKAPNHSNGDWYGHSVGISGDTVFVGSRYEDSSTTSIINGIDFSLADDFGGNPGAAYIYRIE